MVEQAIVSLINDRLPGLVGRVTPVVREQNSLLPAITYQSGESKQELNLDGSPSGLGFHKLQINLWADTYSELSNIRQLLLLLNGYRGTVNGLNIGLIQVSTSDDVLDETPNINTLALIFNVTYLT